MDTLTTYEQATDAEVMQAYETCCAAEVAYHSRGETQPELLTTTTDAWMNEAMRRGLL